jgi:hypothetical protein
MTTAHLTRLMAKFARRYRKPFSWKRWYKHLGMVTK